MTRSKYHREWTTETLLVVTVTDELDTAVAESVAKRSLPLGGERHAVLPDRPPPLPLPAAAAAGAHAAGPAGHDLALGGPRRDAPRRRRRRVEADGRPHLVRTAGAGAAPRRGDGRGGGDESGSR